MCERLGGGLAVYHGCDLTTATCLFAGGAFVRSENVWDWLGHGIYFWEANPQRGLEFAEERKARGKITEPTVVGAVIDLGYCLDLVFSTGIAAVRGAYTSFAQFTQEAGQPIPKNRGGDEDRLLRELDCAVINHLHHALESDGKEPFQTVRAVFVEGGRIYEEAGFFTKTHIQICVRDPRCIKGVFRVPDDQLS